MCWSYCVFCLPMIFAKINWIIFYLLCICSFCYLNVVTMCIPCHIWFMKWIWWLILGWDLLDDVLNWLKLIHVNFHVLFWIFSPSLTLGLALVVCCLCLSFDFRLNIQVIWFMMLPHLSLWCLPLTTNIVCFVGLLTHLRLTCWLMPLLIGFDCLIFMIVCLSV